MEERAGYPIIETTQKRTRSARVLFVLHDGNLGIVDFNNDTSSIISRGSFVKSNKSNMLYQESLIKSLSIVNVEMYRPTS